MGAVALGVGLALAGCTTTPQPTPTASASATRVPSATPSPSAHPTRPAPTRPVAMATMDGNGAAAAAVYFIELYGYVLQTGDLTEWNAMSFPDCQFCESTAQYVQSVYSAGGSFVGGDITAEVVTVHELDGFIGGYPVDLRTTQAATKRLDAAGAQAGSLDQQTNMARFATVYYKGSWTIATVVRLVGAS
ncbi:MAG: DUF6318 family protein [Cellulomonas sp.]